MPLFANEDVLAVDKPPGVSLATSRRDPLSGRNAVARLLAACGEPADDTALLVHRLDLGTSGVVLLARGDAVHRRLTQAFQAGRTQKTYRALVWGHPRPARGTLDAPLGRDPSDGRRMRIRADGKRAVTRYESIERLPSTADLEVTPETGRTHQIRVHLAAKGHPIVGDDLYGGSERWRGVRTPALRRALAAIARPLLHAARIVVPELGIDVSSPLPEDYRELLATLKAARTAGWKLP